MRRLACIVILIYALSCCIIQEPSESAMNETPKILKGVSLSPRSFQSDDFLNFFQKAQYAGTVISWAGDWDELHMENGGPKVIAELAKTHGYIPFVEVQFFEQSSGDLLRPLSEETKQSYLTRTVAFTKMYTPMYFAVGIEVNVLYEKSPEEFEEFVTFYNEVYHAVKDVSPETKVFTVFQLERMKGLHGGLFGGENDSNNAQWWLLEKFPLDMVAFTTYPGLIYKDPSQIPAEYYIEISQHTELPVAFTEIGWHSNASPSGWESSETEQAAFVATFFRLLQNVNVELAVWSFLYDQDIHEPFNSMGLYGSDGKAKLAWNVWVNSGREGIRRLSGLGVTESEAMELTRERKKSLQQNKVGTPDSEYFHRFLLF